MKIAGAWLSHPGTVALCRAIDSAGFRALFVGGCVRNAILGRAVDDIDIATDAAPEIVTNIAENAGFKVVPTGIEHGTVTVVCDGRAHEVTTFRRDVQTDGRRAVVAFSDKIEEDAARRDFTMNALYANILGEVLDPLDGLKDLLGRHVRFVGDPETRIREDYLRILRFFRFHAHYGDADEGLNAEGLAACAALSAGIETLSRERIGAEMRKLLAAPDPAPALASMAQAGILARVLPGAEPRPLAPFVHLSEIAGLQPDAMARLAAIGGDDPGEALKLSRAQARRHQALRDAATSMMGAGELGYRLGSVDGMTALVLRAALLDKQLSGGEDVARGANAHFPIRAADLPDLKGPELGAALRRLEADWIRSGFRLTKQQLLG